MKRWLLIALLLAGCDGPSRLPFGQADIPNSVGASTNLAAGEPIGNVLGIDRYYPLERTYTWTYQVTITDPDGTKRSEDIRDITRIESVSGNKSAQYSSARWTNGQLTSQSTGTIEQTMVSLTISGGGGTETISLPLTNGKTWTSGTLEARCFTVGNLTVKGVSYQDVMAIAYTKDHETRAVRWFAPGVGIIRQAARVKSDGQEIEVLSELTKAQVSAVTMVSLAPASLDLTVGATASVNAQVFYDDGSIGRECTLASLDPGVATVNNGVVRGIAAGTATLKAISAQDSTKAATISVKVQ